MKDIFWNARQIAQACKINIERIQFYVDEHKLPAFKDSPAKSAKWKARPASLKVWAKAHEKKHLKK